MELQVHGGAAVVAAVLAALGELPGYRQALAGVESRLRDPEIGKVYRMLCLGKVEMVLDAVNFGNSINEATFSICYRINKLVLVLSSNEYENLSMYRCSTFV